MSDYKGSTSQDRVLILERERERERNRLKELENKIRSEAEKNQVANFQSKFSVNTSSVEEQLKRDTIGLVTLDEFTKRKNEIIQEEKKRINATNSDKKKQQKRAIETSTLSFGDDLEEEIVPKKKKIKNDATQNGEDSKTTEGIMKNPNIDTSFLPDKLKEEQERNEREALRKQYLEEQERIKEQPIDITYSYWDGTGHRGVCNCKKGTSVEGFLYKVQQDWKELKRISVGDLMFVKEDIIIPHHYTFYDLIVTKARGKSGPLFTFEVQEDVRAVTDTSIETEESHAGKVVDRRWYNRNKHLFPYNRWEVYDPKKDYGKYSYGSK
ncbi:circadian clock regulator protein [Acrasis kona]|uniref:Circadian clock regulator protein n=1 Tax=Acrasis kona TaxID=1008807 RepID=A0AAW2YMU9_9EUKA